MLSENSELDILLINPPYGRLKGFYEVHFPLNLGYLAAALRKNFNVRIYDMENPMSDREEYLLRSDVTSHKLSYSRLFPLSDKYIHSLEVDSLSVWKEAEDIFLRYRPKIIALTCRSVEYPAALKVAKIYKTRFPQGIVIFGGSHPTIQSETVLSTHLVDFVVRGEADMTIIELVAALLKDGITKEEFAKIDGISFYNKNSLIHTKNRELLPDLDVLEFPARDLLIKPIKEKSAYGHIMGSRGCPFACGFCSAMTIWGRKVRYRSIPNIIKEIEKVISEYKTKEFKFWDDSFTLNRTWTLQLLSNIEKIKIEWECITRVDLVDFPLLKEMKKAGCYMIAYGIESGSERMLKMIGKNINLFQINKAGYDTIKAGISPKGYLMLGFPDETEEDVCRTIEFARRTKYHELALCMFTPYPGSPLFERARELGLITEDINWAQVSYLSTRVFFTQCITTEKFNSLRQELIQAIDRHNTSIQMRLIRAMDLIINNPKFFVKKVVSKLRDTK